MDFKPLEKNTWKDLEQLFGPKGACGGCWCMYWRLKNAEFQKHKGGNLKEAMKGLVNQQLPIGVLAYIEEQPVGWCAIAPREVYTRLNNSRILAPVDDKSVWSIVCFFIDRHHRRQGLSKALIKAAIDYAQQLGAKLIEAYPIAPKKEKVPPVFAYTGLASAFSACGFHEVARRSETRPIMRLVC